MEKTERTDSQNKVFNRLIYHLTNKHSYTERTWPIGFKNQCLCCGEHFEKLFIFDIEVQACTSCFQDALTEANQDSSSEDDSTPAV